MRFLPLLLTLLITLSASAEIIHIPDDFESIQLAIRDDNTRDGDIILIEPGVYDDTLNFAGKDITVASRYLDTGDESYIARTIVQGNGSYRMAVFRNGETSNARLIGLTIKNGYAQYGGGVYFNATSPRLSHLVICQNVASNNGGGVYATSEAAPELDHVIIYGNEGDTFGGVNCYNGATITLTNSIVYRNTPTEYPEELVATFSDIEEGFNGDGNIDADPIFEDPDAGDFTLHADSPCINTGDPDSDPDPDGSRADIGAIAFMHIPDIDVNPLALFMGARRVQERFDGNIRILNIAAVPLSVESISIVEENSPFSIIAGGDRIDLDPDESVVVTVRFSPVEVGEFAAGLRIESNDPEENVIIVALTGVGLPPAPEIGIDPVRIDFGDVALRSNNELPLTVRNIGSADLLIESTMILDAESDFGVEFEANTTLQPGQSLAIPVSYLPLTLGDHVSTLRITSNDDDEQVIDVPLNGTTVLPQLRNEFVGNTGRDHSFLILSCEFAGESLVYGSEVAIFNQNDLCCGADYWLENRLGLAAWGDNEMTEAIDGWRDGEAFSFKIWDLAAGEELIPEVEIVEGNESFEPNGLTVVRLSGEAAPDGFKIYIADSWGMVSAPVIPEETNIVRLWAPIVERHHLMIMKDGGGLFYQAQFGFSNMRPWDFGQGYQVRGLAVDSLDLGGNYVASDTPIPVRVGWNLVAYFPEEPLSVQVALQNDLDHVTLVKDAFGHFFIPSVGFSNMGPLRRGNAYQVRSSAAAEIIWNVPEEQVATTPPGHKTPEHFVAPSQTGASMSVLLTGDKSLQHGEIAVVTPDGRIVGAACLQGPPPWGTAVWGDDEFTDIKDGALHGEALSFRHFDGRVESPLNAEWSHSNCFEADALAEVKLSAVSILPLTLSLESPQPNPFNNRTTLTFNLPQTSGLKLSIIDLEGREIATLADGEYRAGVHRAVWNANGVASGLYIARLQAGGQSLTSKLMLIR